MWLIYSKSYNQSTYIRGGKGLITQKHYIMLSENDKKNLFGGKKCIRRYFAKRDALKELNRLIEEAGKILEKYPPVDFSNAFETAYIQNGGLALELKTWSLAADNMFGTVFGNFVSDVQQKFDNAKIHNDLHEYAGIRSTLVERRRILIEFRDDINAL